MTRIVRLLSDREATVIQQMADGYSSKESARVLGLAEATIKIHRKSLFNKIGARIAPHAVAIGIRTGLIAERYPDHDRQRKRAPVTKGPELGSQTFQRERHDREE